MKYVTRRANAFDKRFRMFCAIETMELRALPDDSSFRIVYTVHTNLGTNLTQRVEPLTYPLNGSGKAMHQIEDSTLTGISRKDIITAV